MSLVQSSFPESLDQVLEAVKETPRGRWFLENFEQRVRNDGTSKVLDSIAKLENHIQSLSVSGADQVLLKRAREAISAARRDIAAIEKKPAELSSEAQLFAKLANLSKSSFNDQPGLGQGVERALRLVSDLDDELNASNSNTPKVQPTQFFKQDDAIFEPAPAAKIVKAVSKPEIVADTTPRGAKLVIQRVGAPAPTVQMPTIPTVAEAPIEQSQPERIEPPVFAEVAKAEPLVTPTPSSRIVIIRRKADEVAEVPLLENTATETTSAA